jgi:putative resolvase
VSARQLAIGTILVDEPSQSANGIAICAWVSSGGQRDDLDQQVAPLTAHLAASGIAPAEVGSGLNGRRTRLLGMLRGAWVGAIVVEHRERLARFGVEYLEAVLVAQGRRPIVVEYAEVSDDLVRDMMEILTSFCAWLYGRRSAKHRACLATAAAQTDRAA